MLRRIGVTMGLALLLVAGSSSAALPPGFSRTIVASGLVQPTCVEFAPDGRLFIGERGGRILVMVGTTPTQVIQLPVSAPPGEMGVSGLAFDPQFAANGWLYVFYTTTAPRDRVSRFTVIGNSASLDSEFVVWEHPDLAVNFHHGGGIDFGPDGNLYIPTGEQTSSQNSQSLASDSGKILRLRRDGTIPPDNPFLGTPGARPGIWALGFRNPYRIAFDSLLGTLWIGDVGGNEYEEINAGAAGEDYGWNDQEGLNCYVSSCAGITFPEYTYPHDFPGGSSVILGPVYRGSAFPAEYVGSLFFGDYARQEIRRLRFDENGFLIDAVDFDTSPGAGSIVDLEVGPDGALYTAEVGFTNEGNPTFAGVHRIAYSPGNLPPVVVVDATPREGLTPLGVGFSSAGTFDPDSGPSPLAYAWSFDDGNGSSAANPGHVYVDPGRYTAQLEVGDGAATASAEVVIQAGSPPQAQILAPATGTTYRAGDVIPFSGSASDPPFGALPPSAFSWKVLLRHLGHTHPFAGPITGVTSSSFEIPTSGHSPENTFFDVVLDVTDSDGLVATETVSVLPVVATLALDTQPSGIPIFLDGQGEATPRSYASVPGYEHTVEAQESFVLGLVTYTFDSWSDGGARVHVFTTPEGGATLTAAYVATGDGDGDGVPAGSDNCPTVANAAQTDVDSDAVGDACDNCMTTPNPRIVPPRPAWMTITGGQHDGNANGRGDACDFNYDGIGPVILASDFQQMKVSVGRLVAGATCGTSGTLRCQLFDHTESGPAITSADFNLVKPQIGKLVPPLCPACGNFALLPCEGPACP